MKFLSRLLLVQVTILGFSCSVTRELSSDNRVEGSLEQIGLIEAYPAGTKYQDGLDLFCESSAVTRVAERLVVASDKPVPEGSGLSPVFSFPVTKKFPKVIKDIRYEGAPLFQSSRKIESMAYSPQTDLYFAATAFDRIKLDSDEWDAYNMLFYWSADQFDQARVLFKNEDGAKVSSKNMREALTRVVRNTKFPGGVSYYKIEGLAVLPNNQIVFGVREMGRSYEDFDYSFLLLSTSFVKTRSGIIINPDWNKIFEFDPSKMLGSAGESLGVSSLEYHAPTKTLLALTTFEGEKETFATNLWMIPMSKRLRMDTKPILVRGADGQPLTLPYKGEGLTLLDNKRLFIVFDEDRRKTEVASQGLSREPHQGMFGVVKLKY